jgi:MFS family permease
MSKARTEVLADSRRKGTVAGITTAAAVGAGVLIGPVTAVVVAVPAAVLTWRWWKHRAENGIKF